MINNTGLCTQTRKSGDVRPHLFNPSNTQTHRALGGSEWEGGGVSKTDNMFYIQA